MVRALPFIIPIALALYALIDLYRSEATERAGLHPAAWVAIIVLLPVIGPIAWIAVSVSSRNAGGRAPAPATGPRGGPARPSPSSTGRPRPTRRSGPVAPDDDPDFLWRLEQEERRRRRTSGAGGRPAPDAAAPAEGPATTDAGTGPDVPTDPADPTEPTDPKSPPDPTLS